MLRDKNFLVFLIGMAAMLTAATYGVFFKAPVPDSATFKDEFALVLTDYDGNEIPLSEFRREVLIVYMWASWCPYCSDELRNLATLKRTYGDKIRILAVNRAEPRAVAKEYTDALGLQGEMDFLLDMNDALYKDIEGYAMPETVFIDERGTITFHQRGPIQVSAVEEKIKELLQ